MFIILYVRLIFQVWLDTPSTSRILTPRRNHSIKRPFRDIATMVRDNGKKYGKCLIKNVLLQVTTRSRSLEPWHSRRPSVLQCFSVSAPGRAHFTLFASTLSRFLDISKRPESWDNLLLFTVSKYIFLFLFVSFFFTFEKVKYKGNPCRFFFRFWHTGIT